MRTINKLASLSSGIALMANPWKNFIGKLVPCIGFILCSVSCTESEEICENCYLYSIKEFLGSSPGSTLGVYYNSQGLVSEFKIEADPELFIEERTIINYEYNGRFLKSIRAGGYSVDYYYDDENRIAYSLELFNGVFRDSIIQDYNSENLISTITYFDRLTHQQMRRREFEYSGKNSTVLKYYEKELGSPGEPPLIATLFFEFDANPIPNPKETWPFAFSFAHHPMAENNITKKILRVNGQPDTVWEYSYVYNSQGYPIERRSSTGHVEKYHYTCLPRFEKSPF